MMTRNEEPLTFEEYQRRQKIIDKTVDKVKHSAVMASFAANSRRTTFQITCEANILKTLEIKPESLELANPDRFFKHGRDSVEKVCYLPSTKEFPIEKIKLEIDVLTGHAILSFD